jgi:hypothetical protein
MLRAVAQDDRAQHLIYMTQEFATARHDCTEYIADAGSVAASVEGNKANSGSV